jgi:periplasmic protein TonB
MRPLSTCALAIVIAVSSFSVAAQTASSQAPPQTARQALIEMFFGQAPGHFEKHLPDVTRQTLDKIGGVNGQGGIFSALAAQSNAGKEKLETFDAGPTLLISKNPALGGYEKTEITVERDDLLGDEDQIELALHLTRNGKEEPLLAMILRFTFSMKLEAEIWRLNEVGATARFPLADPAFLKAIEEDHLRQNEQTAQWSVRMVVNAEKSYQAAEGSFACTLSALGSAGKTPGASRRVYLYDSQLLGGKKNGYSFAISDCSSAHYWVVAEPQVPDSGQRAFCSDESGTLRASTDEKGSTCVAGGDVVEDPTASTNARAVLQNNSAPQNSSTFAASQPGQRVRISQGVSTALLVSKVQPVYPPPARQARIQGQVVLKALINQTGDVVSLELVSGHPMLAPAALEAVKQWKYRPYLLNGKAVNVETQVTVNFKLSEPPKPTEPQ